MATRCLYCGGSSWRPFRWLRDQDFCSNKHRELYRARLQKVVSSLTIDAADAEVEVVAGPPPGEPAPVYDPPTPTPEIPEAGPAEMQMAPAIVLRNGAAAE